MNYTFINKITLHLIPDGIICYIAYILKKGVHKVFEIFDFTTSNEPISEFLLVEKYAYSDDSTGMYKKSS